jgi:hypothetical protein
MFFFELFLVLFWCPPLVLTVSAKRDIPRYIWLDVDGFRNQFITGGHLAVDPEGWRQKMQLQIKSIYPCAYHGPPARVTDVGLSSTWEEWAGTGLRLCTFDHKNCLWHPESPSSWRRDGELKKEKSPKPELGLIVAEAQPDWSRVGIDGTWGCRVPAGRGWLLQDSVWEQGGAQAFGLQKGQC